MKLAVFDLDHTLMPMDTSGSWVIWMTAASGLRLEPVLAAVRKFDADYDAGRLDIDEFMATQMQWLARFRRAHLERVREAFTKYWLAPNVPQASLDLVESHRAAGDVTAVCTASSIFWRAGRKRMSGVNLRGGLPAETVSAPQRLRT